MGYDYTAGQSDAYWFPSLLQVTIVQNATFKESFAKRVL